MNLVNNFTNVILNKLKAKMVKQKELSTQPRNYLKETMILILFYWFTDQLCQAVAEVYSTLATPAKPLAPYEAKFTEDP